MSGYMRIGRGSEEFKPDVLIPLRVLRRAGNTQRSISEHSGLSWRTRAVTAPS